jgi:DNA invertase Pin-like site-specific DNA recombinase
MGTGTNRARPGLDQALAAVRAGDTFTVTKLDRLARSVPDALAILNQLSDRGVRFALGASVYDWNDPFSRMFLQILAVVVEFEANLIRQRTREGMVIAKAKGKLRGKQPKLKPGQAREVRRMHDSGDCTVVEIAEMFNISRPTVYRTLDRVPHPKPHRPTTTATVSTATATATATIRARHAWCATLRPGSSTASRGGAKMAGAETPKTLSCCPTRRWRQVAGNHASRESRW